MMRMRAGWWLLGLLFVVVGGIGLSTPARIPLPTGPRVASIDATPSVPVKTVDLDPFTATPAELCFLPGIGPRLARRLHREIHRQGLTQLDQLTQVAGIGPARLKAIRMALPSQRGR